MLKVQEFQNFTGIEYLKMSIACMHDKTFEKEKWNDRLNYFESLDLKDQRIYKKASNPVGLRAAVIALEDTEKDEASGYTISIDASSSGLQILSLLASCSHSFKLCGGDADIRDAYVHIYDQMDLDEHIERPQLKDTIMTALYGSEASPRNLFGENVDYFYDMMETIAPGAWNLNLGIQDLWSKMKDAIYDWTLPDNFYACIETQDKEITKFTFLEKFYSVVQKVVARPKFHKGLGPNLIHSIDGMIVREMFRRCMFKESTTTRVINAITTNQKGTDGRSADMVKILWDHYLETNFLSVRILDYLYGDTMGLVDPMVIAKLIQTLPNKSFSLLSVHDCFRCHPNNGNDVRKQYNHILADIADSTILSSIASQAAKMDVNVGKTDYIDRNVILNANYTLS